MEKSTTTLGILCTPGGRESIVSAIQPLGDTANVVWQDVLGLLEACSRRLQIEPR